MNEFDQFVKHRLRVRRYIRYTDDFVVVAGSRQYLEALLPSMSAFLGEELSLELHPKKVSIRTLYQGVDFLGYITFPRHRLIRTKTKRRILRALQQRMNGYVSGALDYKNLRQSLQSYLGVLSHADARRFSERLQNMFWLETRSE